MPKPEQNETIGEAIDLAISTSLLQEQLRHNPVTVQATLAKAGRDPSLLDSVETATLGEALLASARLAGHQI
jgi:hypothetical protein